MEDADALARAIGAVAGFAGTVRLDVGGETLLRSGFGLADRARGLPMQAGTRLAIASGSKTFTSLAVLSLVDDGVLALDAPAREWLGTDLPLIADDVTIEHLLSHRSGIGDYFDEDLELDDDAYVLPLSVHLLDTTEAYLPLLEGHPAKFPAGTSFSYCNQAFVVLALVAERASGTPFHDLVDERVFRRAGMRETAYLRSDDLPGDAALGYVTVDGQSRSNVFHLPVRGNGDGGAFTTVDDVHRFWPALYGGAIVSEPTVAEMLRPRSEPDGDGRTYGLGVWLWPADGMAQLVGQDAGVSFTSVRDPRRDVTWTVIANRAGSAWPVQQVVTDQVDALVGPPRLQE